MITIQTKGIYDPRSGAAGWGASVDGDLIGGRIYDRLHGPHEAELYALTGALTHLLRRGRLAEGDTVRARVSEPHLPAMLLTICKVGITAPGCVPAQRVTRRISHCGAAIDLAAMLHAQTINLEVAFEAAPSAVTHAAQDSMRLRRAELT